ncbi:MAG TPA: hypothetical protein VFR18_11270, partial [Terriglobia bacterium]|nr:hypothetical protein [Terriglobia bacterium]
AKLGEFQSQGSISSGVGGLTDIASIANGIFTQLYDFVTNTMSTVGPGPLKDVLDRVTSASRARLQAAVTPDLIGSLIDFVRYGQEELFDYSMTLFSPLTSVTHNRFYLSPDATDLSLDIARGGNVAGALVNVYATLLNATRVDIATILLADLPDGDPVTGGDFVRRILALPAGLAGEVMTLTFELVGGGLSGPTVWLDDITFASKVKVTDTSRIPDDALVLFLDDVNLDPDRLTRTSPILPLSTPINLVQGNNQHNVTITNDSTETVSYRIGVEPNWFLVLIDDGSGTFNNPLALNANEREMLPNTYTLPPGATLTLTFAATLNKDALEKLTVEDAWMMRGNIFVQELGTTGGGGTYVRSQTGVQTYYLADVSDWARDDGILQFADTLDGQERVIRIRNESPFIFSIDPNGAAADRFDMIGQNGTDIRVKFKAVGVDATPVQNPLIFSLSGSEMARIKVEGRSEAVQELQLPLESLAAQLSVLYDTVTQLLSGQPPANPPLIAVGVDPVTGAADYSVYQAFYNAFSVNLLTATQAFLDGVRAGVRELLGLFIDGTFGGSLSLIEVPLADTTNIQLFWSGDIPGHVGTEGEAPHDIRAEALFGETGLLEGSLALADRPAPAILSDWALREDLNPAAKRFRLDALTNLTRQNLVRMFTDTIIIEAGRSGLTTAFDMGRAFGLTVSHEYGHNFGLFDEYRQTANSSYPWTTRYNMMTTGFNFVLADSQKLVLALALDNVAASNALFGFNGAGDPRAIMLGAVEEARRLLLFDTYNYPNLPDYNLTIISGNGPPEDDPL